MMWTVSLPRYSSANHNQSHGFLSNSVRAHSKYYDSFSWKSGAQESCAKRETIHCSFPNVIRIWKKLKPNTLISSQHATIKSKLAGDWTKACFPLTSSNVGRTPLNEKLWSDPVYWSKWQARYVCSVSNWFLLKHAVSERVNWRLKWRIEPNWF